MKKLTLLVVLFFSISLSAQNVQLSWQKDFNTAQAMATSQNKNIIVFFTKTDCQSCLQFYSDFFKQPTFENLAQNYVLLMIDGSNQDIQSRDMAVIQQRRLARHYNKASAYPAVLTLDKEGMEVGEIMTSTDEASTKEYLSFLQNLK